MRRSIRGRHKWLQKILILGFAPLLVVGFGYALFSQDLSVQGTGRTVARNLAPDLRFSYGISANQNGGRWDYSLMAILINHGNLAASNWEVVVNLSGDISDVSCDTISCIQTGDRQITLSNLAGSGEIVPGGRSIFMIDFSSVTSSSMSVDNHQIDNDTSARPTDGYVTINNLNISSEISFSADSSDGSFYRQYTIVAQNNSVQNLQNWRVYLSNWNSSMSVVIAWFANYVAEPNQLILTSQNALNAGAQDTMIVRLRVFDQNFEPNFLVKGLAA